MRSGIVVQAIEAFEAGIHLSEIKAKAERLTSLKGLVEGFERQIEASPEAPGGDGPPGPGCTVSGRWGTVERIGPGCSWKPA